MTNSEQDQQRNTNHMRTYSLAQIASKIDRPASTIRTWKDQYSEYVEGSSIGKGRNKRYKEDAIRIFSLIDEMKGRNEPHELIKQILADNVDEIIYTPDDEDRPPALMNEILDSYKNIAEVIKSQEDRIKELEAYIKESNEQAKQREIEREQRATEAISNLSQQLEQQQKYIAESLKVRDEKLMESLRLSQEARQQVAAARQEKYEELQLQIGAMKEEKSRGFWSSLFGKNN
jgi:hypothetical protein